MTLFSGRQLEFAINSGSSESVSSGVQAFGAKYLLHLLW